MNLQTPGSVVIVPYDPKWSLAFQALKEAYLRTLGDFAIAIEHVGSTAVPGLAAKPVIDIDVVVPSHEILPVVISRLAELGYRHQGDLGVSGREAFSRDTDGPWRMDHHLHVGAAECELHRHLAFRDWLRARPAEAANYAALKLHLARVYPDDREAYTRGKTEFIEAALLRAAELSRHQQQVE